MEFNSNHLNKTQKQNKTKKENFNHLKLMSFGSKLDSQIINKINSEIMLSLTNIVIDKSTFCDQMSFYHFNFIC